MQYKKGDKVIRTEEHPCGSSHIGDVAVLEVPCLDGETPFWKVRKADGQLKNWEVKNMAPYVEEDEPIQIGDAVRNVNFEHDAATIIDENNDNSYWEVSYWTVGNKLTNGRWAKTSTIREDRTHILNTLETSTKEEEKDMNLNITKPTLINGQEADGMSDEDIISYVREAEEQIKSYEGIEAKSTAIDNKVKSLKKGIKELVKILDAR